MDTDVDELLKTVGRAALTRLRERGETFRPTYVASACTEQDIVSLFDQLPVAAIWGEQRVGQRDWGYNLTINIQLLQEVLSAELDHEHPAFGRLADIFCELIFSLANETVRAMMRDFNASPSQLFAAAPTGTPAWLAAQPIDALGRAN